jgi:hypothetical protein
MYIQREKVFDWYTRNRMRDQKVKSHCGNGRVVTVVYTTQRYWGCGLVHPTEF